MRRLKGSSASSQVLRGAGYFEHALFVAQAAGEAGWYLDILLGDCESYDEALAYLQGLGRAEAGEALKRHGKARPGIGSTGAL